MAAINLGLTSPDRSWMEDALCAGSEELGDLFFATDGESIKQARRICAECPVTESCREYADAQGFTIGVWGNASGAQRKRDQRLKDSPPTDGTASPRRRSNPRLEARNQRIREMVDLKIPGTQIARELGLSDATVYGVRRTYLMAQRAREREQERNAQ